MGDDLAVYAARILWEELERLDPGIDPAALETWDEVDPLTQDLYVRAMRRALCEVRAKCADNDPIVGGLGHGP